MKRMIKYPSINQYRQTVKEIVDRSCFIGLDEDGKAQFDYLKPKPVVTFNATEKVHGTNSGICYSTQDGIWTQSRENIITPEKDNMGFAFFVEQNKDVVIKIIRELADENRIDLNTNIISLYGEWAGGSIQKNSALTGCDKIFVIFEHFKVSPIIPNEEEKSIWFKTITYTDFGVPQPTIEWADSPDDKIFNIMNFNTWSFEIDFNAPERSQNELVKLVDEVIEPASPLGKVFGQESNIGEGIVCSYLTEDGALVQFKVKGDAHSAKSKVTTLKPVDLEKLNAIDKCVEEICHNWRFEQAIGEVFGADYENNLDRKRIGEVIKWVTSDTIKEESDIISKYGFEPKDVMGKVSQKTKEYFFSIEKL